MKFLCDSCKAKYQIADEKIAGRTLRMKCRKCGHDIIIRADKGSAEGSAPAKPQAAASGGARSRAKPAGRGAGSDASTRTSGGASHRPAALGSEFRRQVSSSGSASVRPTPKPLDQWHVAINDVPVGPVKRDELARKIATGAVSGDSLVWREGFDDWRALRDVPELGALLRQARKAPPPPRAAPASRSAGARTGSSSQLPQVGSRRSPGSPRADDSRPAAQGNVIPIGGRLGGGAAPAVEPSLPEEDESATQVGPGLPAEPPAERQSGEQAAVQAGGQSGSAPFDLPFTDQAGSSSFPAPPPAEAAPEGQAAPRRKRGITVSPATLFVGLFVVVFAAVLAWRIGGLLAPAPSGATASTEEPATPEATDEPEAPSAPEAELDLGAEEDVGEEPVDEEPAAEPDEEEQERAGGSRREKTRRARSDTRSGSSGSSGSGKQLSAEEREKLARFAGGSSASTDLNVPSRSGSSRSGSSGEQLTGKQLSKVVSSNKRQLGRCYDNAIRGLSNPPKARMDVRVTVGRSGAVTRVSVSGNGVGDLKSCIETAVRRWRFPSAGASTQTQFPLVFQPGS